MQVSKTARRPFRNQLAAAALMGTIALVALCAVGPNSGPQTERLTLSGGQIDITLPDAELSALSRDQLIDWAKSAASAVSAYYGRFPLPHLTLQIRARNGSGVRHGVTYPTNGGLILISVGRDTTVEELRQDWTMTHEMIHLAFPSMQERHHWIEEGLSTYVEPVARARTGQISESEVWKQFVEDMPKGQPLPGDEGLDVTHTWGRTYWGGALFCLLADVEIRERTQNRKSLQDALRAIMNHGGTITEDWSIEKAFAIGDRATGVSVLQKLYREMGSHPITVNMEELWQKLGVSLSGNNVIFDDHAPEAQIRKSITRP